jgi:hypothetical protein
MQRDQATETAPPLQTADLAADEGCREGHNIPSSSPRGEWQQLAAEPDIERVVEMFKTAIDRDAQGFDIGFAPTGRPTRVVWADVEVIRVGVLLPEELPPDVPPGSKAFDMRVVGFLFVEHPDAEPVALGEAT